MVHHFVLLLLVLLVQLLDLGFQLNDLPGCLVIVLGELLDHIIPILLLVSLLLLETVNLLMAAY
jgi:hypothetical protein